MGPPRLRVVTPDDSWRDHLVVKVNDDGKERVLEKGVNVARILTRHPDWKGKIRRNLWTGTIDTPSTLPWNDDQSASGPTWTDNDTTKLQHWIASQVQLSISYDEVDRAVEEVATKYAHDPACDWLSSLKWDGVPRLDTWLKVYLGGEASDGEYLRQAGRRWLISAVARVFAPGCPAHHMLILEGDQGLGKSTALRILGGEWFCDTKIDMENKDSYMIMRGKLIIEMAELNSIRSARDIEVVKGFVTSPKDTYRPPYGRRVIEVARRCVFAGSVNHAQYFHDPTGNRRFWPVKCTRIDTPRLGLDRDQLWAESVVAFRAGEKWHPETRGDAALFALEQQDRVELDIWHDPVVAHLHQMSTATTATTVDAFDNEPADDGLITIPKILAALGVKKENWTPHDGGRIGKILRHLGYREERQTVPPRKRYWKIQTREPGEDG